LFGYNVCLLSLYLNFTDIDECSSPRLNGCSQNCVNTLGSFKCSCEAGFKANVTQCEGRYSSITSWTRNFKRCKRFAILSTCSC